MNGLTKRNAGRSEQSDLRQGNLNATWKPKCPRTCRRLLRSLRPTLLQYSFF